MHAQESCAWVLNNIMRVYFKVLYNYVTSEWLPESSEENKNNANNKYRIIKSS